MLIWFKSALVFVNAVFSAFQIHLFEIPDRSKTGQSGQPILAARDLLILWNVGQGQWATIATKDSCFHFDMGGEHINWNKLLNACGLKKNFAFFSHWDVDHLSLALLGARHLNNFCVAALPRGPCRSLKKLKLFSDLPKCLNKKVYSIGGTKIEEIYQLSDTFHPHFSSNDYSRVFEYDHWMLAQGDSPKKQEKIWSQDIKQPSAIRVLILGHHGSRTSTSEKLLSTLPRLSIALASARKARYGHPHSEILQRLKNFGVATLSTEQWGNIQIELPIKK